MHLIFYQIRTYMIMNIKAQNIQLSKQAPQHLLIQIDESTFNELNSEDQWSINGQYLAHNHFNVIFSVSQTIRIQTLAIKNMQGQSFIQRILTPKFEQLTFLKICDCQISSIESLSFINAPVLEQLNIGSNRITSLLPLVKLNSLNLNQISIDKNNIKNPQNFFRYLTRCPIGGKTRVCEMMKIETKAMPLDGYPILQCQDLSFFAKLYCYFLMDLKFLHITRIQQETFRQCRRRKNLSSIVPHIISYN